MGIILTVKQARSKMPILSPLPSACMQQVNMAWWRLWHLMKTRNHYLSLILFKTRVELEAEAQRTFIGFAWWLFDPIISLVTYYLVFALLFQRGGADFVGVLFVGIVLWRWFQNTILHGASSILIGRGLMQQVFLPKVILPATSILTDSFKFLFVFLVMLCFLWAKGYAVSVAYLALPVMLLAALALTSGVTFIAAAIVPFVPDIRIALSHVLQLGLFVSAVFFTEAEVPAKFSVFLRWNPMAQLIEGFRDILLHQRWPDWWAVAWVTALAMILLAIGRSIIKRNEFVYLKVV